MDAVLRALNALDETARPGNMNEAPDISFPTGEANDPQSLPEPAAILDILDRETRRRELRNQLQQIEDRLNAHIAILRRVGTTADFDAAYTAYREGFPDIVDDREGMRKAYEDLFKHDLMQIKGALITHADLRLHDIYTV